MSVTTAPVGMANAQHDGFQLPRYGHVQHLKMEIIYEKNEEMIGSDTAASEVQEKCNNVRCP